MPSAETDAARLTEDEREWVYDFAGDVDGPALERFVERVIAARVIPPGKGDTDA